MDWFSLKQIILFSFLNLVLAYMVSTEGVIRCYCNTPECQKTGFSCISTSRKCFSKLYTVYKQENTTSSQQDEHGCIDSTEGSHTSLCDGDGDVVKQLKAFEPLIMCCSDNMCNYRENQDIHVDIISSETIAADRRVDETLDVANRDGEAENKDLMFRAAVIAVPIAGGLILVLLILLAVRMLREDHNRRQESFTGLEKAQSFIEQHFYKKDKSPTRTKVPNENAKSSSERLLATVKPTDLLSSSKTWKETEEKRVSQNNNNLYVKPNTQKLYVSVIPKQNQTKLSHL